MSRPIYVSSVFALLATGLLAFGSACTEHANPREYDPKNKPSATLEATSKPAEPAARDPDSVQYTDGGMAPELASVHFFANTRGMYLQDLRGKYVLMEIFSFTGDSAVDRKLTNRYNAMYKSLLNKGNFQFMSVLTNTGIKDSKALLDRANRMQIGFPVALDADGKVAQEYKAASLPATYLIDPEGKIIFTRAGAGGTDYTENAVRQKLGLELIPEPRLKPLLISSVANPE